MITKQELVLTELFVNVIQFTKSIALQQVLC